MLLKKIILFQAIYYVASGLWPLIDIHSFMIITGPKTDLWLVYMVGLLSFVIGTTLLFHSFKKEGTPGSLSILGIGAAASFAFIDVNYAIQDIIRNTYLVDASIQVILIILWIVILLKEHQAPKA